MVTPKRVVETTPLVVDQIRRRERAYARLRAGTPDDPARSTTSSPDRVSSGRRP
jgi:hypothetical protein